MIEEQYTLKRFGIIMLSKYVINVENNNNTQMWEDTHSSLEKLTSE